MVKVTAYETILDKIRRRTWEDYVLAGMILAFLLIFGQYIAQYTQIPAPLYGGDLYRDRGFVYDIAHGVPAWEDSFYRGEIQYYPYALFIVQASIVKMTGWDVDTVFLLFPLLTLILTGIIWYALGTTIFKHKIWGLLLALAFLTIKYASNAKSGSFAVYVLMPAFLLFWFRYEQSSRRFHAIAAGMFLGSMSLVYGGIFLAAFGMFVFVVAFQMFHKMYTDRAILAVVRQYVKRYWLIPAIATIIALIYFLPLIITYHWHTVNEVSKWGDTGLRHLGPSWVLGVFKHIYFPSGNIPRLILGILALVGTVALFLMKSKESKMVLLIIVANILSMQHFLITKPLLNTWFLPEKLQYFQQLLPVLIVAGAYFLWHLLKGKERTIIIARYSIVVLVAALLLLSFSIDFNNFKEEVFEKHGRSDPSYVHAHYALGSWMDENLKPGDVILSNDETGFMLATVSTHKVMLTRRTHASYFVDIDERIADAAVIMYGQNTTLTNELLGKYGVTYLYVDRNFYSATMRVRPEFETYLARHNISYTRQVSSYDIAQPLSRANTQELLIIPAQNTTAAFDALWQPVYTVEVGGQPVGQLLMLTIKDPQE